MVIFINDRPLYFIEKSQIDNKPLTKFETVVSDRIQIESLNTWKKKVIIPHADYELLSAFFSAIKTLKKFSFKAATFIVKDIADVNRCIQEQYKIINAAGGVILNDESKVLMIYRKGKWDIPKGKADKGEEMIQTAEREVEEECSITVKVLPDYYISYHTYLHKNQRVLKRTYWYKMTLISDAKMKPQKEEDIEEIRWMNRAEMHKALDNSFSSIEHVLNTVLSQELSFSKG
ncbi:MAG: NUDIX domain-containing protein [Cytophagales bacterium]|nr:NUDIX domain-containing protein [Cytophagales bacterium]